MDISGPPPQPASGTPSGADSPHPLTAEQEQRDRMVTLVRERLAAGPPVGPLPADIEGRIRGALAQAAPPPSADDELTDHRVRDVVRHAPRVGPMPTDVEDRILDAVSRETHGVLEASDEDEDERDGAEDEMAPLFPFESNADDGEDAPTRRRWTPLVLALAGVAAAAVILAVLASTLRLNPAPQGITGAVRVELSTHEYDSTTLAAKAGALLQLPGAVPSTTRTSSGPLSTDAGVQACLAGLGVSDLTSVRVDLASYDGQPAAVLVVTTGDGVTTAYAVGRDCTAADPHLLQPGVRVG